MAPTLPAWLQGAAAGHGLFGRAHTALKQPLRWAEGGRVLIFEH
jgi:hypothetical protein